MLRTSALPGRRPDLAKVLQRAALLLCGTALTWLCAAAGLFLLTMPHGCGSKVRRAILQAREIDSGLLNLSSSTDAAPRGTS
jgi:hypothetical protein